MAGGTFENFAARVAGKQDHCLDWDPAKRLSHVESKRGNPRVGEKQCAWESDCDFEPAQTRCLETNFGTSVNDLPKFFAWNEWNTNQLLGQMEWSTDEYLV
ncbi:hypothetical protein AVEN_225805-1 [Araneus ventricosus]|uniref:Uncharacterized protein n=1 Tax=Araneus ventricosus TaxID=182803 RepID=A0A4Y2BA94_ARAVE|nr:hypothetical protein AVEN_225805-1 [Araneus ventricosus]